MIGISTMQHALGGLVANATSESGDGGGLQMMKSVSDVLLFFLVDGAHQGVFGPFCLVFAPAPFQIVGNADIEFRAIGFAGKDIQYVLQMTQYRSLIDRALRHAVMVCQFQRHKIFL